MNDPLHVLVVDDERMYRTLLEKTLVAEGYAVATAVDGNEAIERLRREDFDIVLTDLAMGDVGGLDVLRAAKSLRDDTLVIIITGFAGLDTALAAIGEGVYDYITKPFQLDEIRLTLSNARNHIRLEKERDQLADRLEKAFRTIESLTASRSEFRAKVDEINAEIADRQQSLDDGMRRLRGFHDRVLPSQFGPAAADSGPADDDDDLVERLNQAARLHEQGAITEREFRLLKRRILSE